MTRNSLTKLGRTVSRSLNGRCMLTTHRACPWTCSRTSEFAYTLRHPGYAAFSSSPRFSKPLPADALKTAKPADITDDEYHRLSDQFIEGLLTIFEEEQDAKGEIDVEYSSGVMTLKLPHGSYVINKQPPNKQIWLSSPLSGPKRYDWVVVSEGQDSKQDTATGGWIYLRDGTYLDELLREETGIALTGLGEGGSESL